VLTSDDMIDVKRKRIDRSGQMTVFASVAGTFPDLPNNITVHE
jgi:hypothetical protein